MFFNLFKLLFHMVFLLGCFCVRICKITDNDWDMLEIKQFNRKHSLTTFQTQSYFSLLSHLKKTPTKSYNFLWIQPKIILTDSSSDGVFLWVRVLSVR